MLVIFLFLRVLVSVGDKCGPSLSSEVAGIKAQAGGHHIRRALSGGSVVTYQVADSGKLSEEEAS